MQVPYQREATGLLQCPRQEPFPLQNVRPRFQVVTWLSYNKCLSWEINELHFLSLHFIWPTWLTGSFKSKKRSWKHLLESHAKPYRSPAKHFPTLPPPPRPLREQDYITGRVPSVRICSLTDNSPETIHQVTSSKCAPTPQALEYISQPSLNSHI